jgi:hypothetical protein
MFDICENDTFDTISGKELQNNPFSRAQTANTNVSCGKKFQAFANPKTNQWCGTDVAFNLSKNTRLTGKLAVKNDMQK